MMTDRASAPFVPSTIRIREHDEDPSKEESHHLNYHEYIVHIARGHDHEGDDTDDRSSRAVTVRHLETNRRRRFQQAPLRVLQDLFLPVGYPASVHEGYLEYQIYDSLQGLCSYLRGVLCSAQVLQAAGVGKAEATALSAAMTWALKDGVSMLGGLAYSYWTAPAFDSHVKEFRLFADLINDVGLTLDMLAPYCSSLLVVASAAGLCKTLCGLSAGATKSSITCHFALEGNMADLNAKEATQETLVSLVGMLLGIFLAHRLSGLQESGSHRLVVQLQWTTFLSLTALHVWANWKGVRLLRLRTLNRERAEVALSSVLDELESAFERSDASNSDSLKRVVSQIPSPTQVHESMWSSTQKLLWPGRLKLQARLTDVVRCDPRALSLFAHERYVLTVMAHPHRHVLVALLAGATVQDQLKAFLHGALLCRLARLPSSPEPSTNGSRSTVDPFRKRRRPELLSRTLDCVNRVCGTGSGVSVPALPTAPLLLTELVAKGWDVHERVYLGFPRRRSQWMDADRKKE